MTRRLPRMGPWMWPWIWVVALGCAATPKPNSSPPSQVAGDRAASTPSRPPVSLPDLTILLSDGERLQLASLRDHVVVLEVSASYADGWNELHELHRELMATHGPALRIVTVALERTEVPASEPQWLWGSDPQGAIAARLQISRLPTLFVIDRAGQVVHTTRGYGPTTSSELRSHIERALAR